MEHGTHGISCRVPRSARCCSWWGLGWRQRALWAARHRCSSRHDNDQHSDEDAQGRDLGQVCCTGGHFGRNVHGKLARGGHSCCQQGRCQRLCRTAWIPSGVGAECSGKRSVCTPDAGGLRPSFQHIFQRVELAAPGAGVHDWRCHGACQVHLYLGVLLPLHQWALPDWFNESLPAPVSTVQGPEAKEWRCSFRNSVGTGIFLQQRSGRIGECE
mmetsp:Transcript_104938/g.168996  ORF Transcript_104938/g.168996 Transcript_104938/m.168996 type:complete len:214 (-) Transcript_104938:281-922(-)